VEIIEAKLSIDTVRKLINQVYTQPLTEGGQRAIVVVSDQINIEAQNALLKVLEEPPIHTSFYFVIADHSRLLPTLLSRFLVATESREKSSETAVSFIKLPVAERLALVVEKTAAKDTAWQKDLLQGVEQLCLDRSLSSQIAKEVLFVKKHLEGPGASAKMLLEHLALTI